MQPKMRRQPKDGESGKHLEAALPLRYTPYSLAVRGRGLPRLSWVVHRRSSTRPEPRRDRRLNEVSESFWGTAPPALADSRRPFGGAGPGPRRGAHTRRIPPRRRGGRNWPMGHSGCGGRRAWSRSTGLPGCGSGCRGTSRRRCGKPPGGWVGRAARRRCRRGTAPNSPPSRRPTGN